MKCVMEKVRVDGQVNKAVGILSPTDMQGWFLLTMHTSFPNRSHLMFMPKTNKTLNRLTEICEITWRCH